MNEAVLAGIAFLGALIFGVTGFGSALVTIPLATQLVPLTLYVGTLAPLAGNTPVAVVRCSRFGSALSEAAALKSYVPGRWQVSQAFRMPGNLMSANDSAVLAACQVNVDVLHQHRAFVHKNADRQR